MRRLLLPLLPPAALGLALTACSSSPDLPAAGTDVGSGSALTAAEVQRAEAAARSRLEDDDTVTSAFAVARSGTVRQPNLDGVCTSGRVLDITIVGSFPHIVTSGHPVPPGQPEPDFTVRAVTVSADAATGSVCLVGVRTGENGPITAPADATPLDLG